MKFLSISIVIKILPDSLVTKYIDRFREKVHILSLLILMAIFVNIKNSEKKKQIRLLYV